MKRTLILGTAIILLTIQTIIVIVDVTLTKWIYHLIKADNIELEKSKVKIFEDFLEIKRHG